MRSAAEIRQRYIDRFGTLIRRSGRFGGGLGVEAEALSLLSELCYIDEREDEWNEHWEALRGFGKRGVFGAFRAAFGDDRHHQYRGEIAAVYAQTATQLGYLTLGPGVPDGTFRQLIDEVVDRCADRDVLMDEAREWLPAPTLEIDRNVLAFVAGNDATAWLLLEFDAEWSDSYVPGTGRKWQEGPMLLRDIRLPHRDFTSGLVFTLYGRSRYWDSWIDEPPLRTGDGERAAIAAQLKAIEDADPSERRRRRRA